MASDVRIPSGIIKYFILALFAFALSVILGVIGLFLYFHSDKEVNVHKSDGMQIEIKKKN